MTRALETATAERPPSIRQPGITVHRVPLRPATAETLRGFARIVPRLRRHRGRDRPVAGGRPTAA